jgi:hypothetical protein
LKAYLTSFPGHFPVPWQAYLSALGFNTAFPAVGFAYQDLARQAAFREKISWMPSRVPPSCVRGKKRKQEEEGS